MCISRNLRLHNDKTLDLELVQLNKKVAPRFPPPPLIVRLPHHWLPLFARAAAEGACLSETKDYEASRKTILKILLRDSKRARLSRVDRCHLAARHTWFR